MLIRRLFTAAAAVALAALPSAAASLAVAAPASAAVLDSIRSQQQWVLNMLDVQQAWNVTKGRNVIVAVVDSGVNGDVSDLAGGTVIQGPDYTGLSTSPSSPDWGVHGTWMASIIAGHGHDFGDQDGVMGVAPEARILSIRVIPDSTDPGYHHYLSEPEEQIQDELADGIMAAVKGGAQVISMSIGYSAPSGVVRAALQYAYSHGVVLVASAGNSGHKSLAPVSFPAEYPGVISVGAVDSDRSAASFSSDNLSVTVAAPGNYVPAQGNNGSYYTVNGTSPACALVAGVAALIKSAYPGISPALVTEAITATAQQTPAGSYNDLTGFGIVNADAALAKAGQLVHEPAAGSQVLASAHFGGGAAAVPAAPVPPRGNGELMAFAALSFVCFVAALGGLRVALRTRTPRYRPEHGWPPRYDEPR